MAQMRAVVQETAYVDSAVSVWSKAAAARRSFLASSGARQLQHRARVQHEAINKTLQVHAARRRFLASSGTTVVK